jgi:Tol biopolymer transport system component
VTDAALSPNGHTMAFAEHASTSTGTRSFLARFARHARVGERAALVFAGAGRFADVEWSPDGHWILLNWPSADQWLFIRSAAVKKIRAVSNIRSSFGPNARLAGWCCG